MLFFFKPSSVMVYNSSKIMYKQDNCDVMSELIKTTMFNYKVNIGFSFPLHPQENETKTGLLYIKKVAQS